MLSGRAKCRKCKQLIAKGEVKFISSCLTGGIWRGFGYHLHGCTSVLRLENAVEQYGTVEDIPGMGGQAPVTVQLVRDLVHVEPMAAKTTVEEPVTKKRRLL